ncbi:19739_t:CDS:2, partial [Gigaspora rosea]
QKTNEEREARLARDRERKRRKAEKNSSLQQESERPVIGVSIDAAYPVGENIATTSQSESIENAGASSNLQQESERPVIGVNIETTYLADENIDATSQSENITEYFLSIVLAGGMCYHCKGEKTLPKKFSAENNMDPGKIPEELQGLTEVEEMLIAQVFTVMLVYKLRGGQHGYRGNVINFPQDVQEFTTRLPRHPPTLNILIVHRQSANDLTAFRDFIVCRNVVTNALCWLKANNRYYADIIIDNEVLESLPQEGYIDGQLPQFVPLLPSTNREEVAINSALDRLESKNLPIIWPHIESTPINEFQTPGYI